jgi:hypothetical protein
LIQNSNPPCKVNCVPKTLYCPKMRNRQPTAIRNTAVARVFRSALLLGQRIIGNHCIFVFGLNLVWVLDYASCCTRDDIGRLGTVVPTLCFAKDGAPGTLFRAPAGKTGLACARLRTNVVRAGPSTSLRSLRMTSLWGMRHFEIWQCARFRMESSVQ